jgi:hypothetical protein
MKAIIHGNLNIVNTIINDGADINNEAIVSPYYKSLILSTTHIIIIINIGWEYGPSLMGSDSKA